MEFLGNLLCFLGHHEWLHIFDNVQKTPKYRFCKRCKRCEQNIMCYYEDWRRVTDITTEEEINQRELFEHIYRNSGS